MRTDEPPPATPEYRVESSWLEWWTMVVLIMGTVAGVAVVLVRTLI